MTYKVYNKHVAFWGSEFSNFYGCSFTYKGLRWKSSEQAFMAEKAVYFNDYAAFQRILNSATPAEAKQYGREVKNFDSDEWLKVSKDFMYDVVYAKFSQNERLRNLILDPSLADKGFVEGSPDDGIWGVKVSWDDPRIDNESNWNGMNLLGKVLDEVRESLRNEKLI